MGTIEGRSGINDGEGAMLPITAFVIPTTDTPSMGSETKVPVSVEEELEL